MDVVENTLEVDLESFLQRRLCSVLAQRSDDGPRLLPLWFHWEDQQLYNIVRLAGRSYPDRVRNYPETAVARDQSDAAPPGLETE